MPLSYYTEILYYHHCFFHTDTGTLHPNNQHTTGPRTFPGALMNLSNGARGTDCLFLPPPAFTIMSAWGRGNRSTCDTLPAFFFFCVRYCRETWCDEFFNVNTHRGRRDVSYWNQGKNKIRPKHSCHRTTFWLCWFPSKQQFRDVAPRALEGKAAPCWNALTLGCPTPETHTPSAAQRQASPCTSLFHSTEQTIYTAGFQRRCTMPRNKNSSHIIRRHQSTKLRRLSRQVYTRRTFNKKPCTVGGKGLSTKQGHR